MAAEVHVHDWPLTLDTCSCDGLEVDVMVDGVAVNDRCWVQSSRNVDFVIDVQNDTELSVASATNALFGRQCQ